MSRMYTAISHYSYMYVCIHVHGSHQTNNMMIAHCGMTTWVKYIGKHTGVIAMVYTMHIHSYVHYIKFVHG